MKNIILIMLAGLLCFTANAQKASISTRVVVDTILGSQQFPGNYIVEGSIVEIDYVHHNIRLYKETGTMSFYLLVHVGPTNWRRYGKQFREADQLELVLFNPPIYYLDEKLATQLATIKEIRHAFHQIEYANSHN